MSRRSCFGLLVWALPILAGVMLVAGCETLRGMTPSARKAEEMGVKLQQLQARNMRFAGDYVGHLIEAERLARSSLTDADQRMLSSGWLLRQANAAYIAASGENPIIGTLDLLTLAVLSRMVIDAGEAARPAMAESWLTAHWQLEAQASDLASIVLDSSHQEAARNLFAEWHRSAHCTPVRRSPDDAASLSMAGTARAPMMQKTPTTICSGMS